jgi:formylglycine-generating enzyme required for sulfatase activity
MWVEQAGGRPSYFADDGDLNRLNQPVVGVDWHMCNDFCAWLTQRLGQTIRLPAELEWAAAARGVDARRFPWGDRWHDDRAAIEPNQGTLRLSQPAPVGCSPAGAAPCRALDMAGNVREWTSSEYRSYPEANEAFMSRSGRRVLRGGSFQSGKDQARCAARFGYYSDQVLIDGGFRVLLEPVA